MDKTQKNHLKAYGLTYQTLKLGYNVHWLLNYRGGSFLLPGDKNIYKKALIDDIRIIKLNPSAIKRIEKTMADGNMEKVLLEKAPKVAIYTPPDSEPWDDAVTLALEYAGIEYTKIWDQEVLSNKHFKYDWIHLHHEDFTGQYGKFYAFAKHQNWYQKRRLNYERSAKKYGFKSVQAFKGEVARQIQAYVAKGGFLFAMCSATDTLDIALSAHEVDIIESPLDSTPVDPAYKEKLNYNSTFAFENFELITNPNIYEFSDIDIDPRKAGILREKDYFTLFEFSAKYDPMATILTQNHERIIKGFLGQTTAFNRERVKKRTLILGESVGTNRVRYIHGEYKKGSFTFYGGHDPEDYQHLVGDPPTDLSLHKNSPGYRLILNNILFPAARKKKQKT
jgi:hypothetical protein